ncbi:hypothetical protein FQR65_LT04288 [Abscondita terminalis]|nr:hypothetical protein FQR65_LT04288 [Abscondita terminalis]
MERSKIVPDIIDKVPNSTLNVTYGNLKVNYGNELTPTDVKDPPNIEWPFEKGCFYLVLMTDPDVPCAKEPKDREFQHWLVGNIPGQKICKGDVLTEYIGALPGMHTGIHRYVLLVFKQPEKIKFEIKNLSNTTSKGREKFSTKDFAKKYKLGDAVAEVKRLGSESNVMPSESNVMPSESNVMPSESNVMPSESNVMPSESNVMPSESNVMPSESNVMPSESNVMPSESNVMPSESNVMPSESNVMPSESNVMPSESNVMPSESNVMPSESNVMPSESNVMPSESNVMPSESNVMPSESNVMPSESNVMPSESNVMPSESNVMPSESQTLSYDQTGSVSSQALEMVRKAGFTSLSLGGHS